jgi:hypothetical protein
MLATFSLCNCGSKESKLKSYGLHQNSVIHVKIVYSLFDMSIIF